MFVPSTMFEQMGFHYTGPIDGHDTAALLDTLKTHKGLKGPQLLHIITTKGKGYELAEDDQIGYHAVSPFDPTVGVIGKAGAKKPTYTDVFGDWLCDMAAADSKLLGITPAMREGSGLVRFSQEYPQRYFDVAIAEQHAITLAAGMACEGAKPVVAIYSSFLQRGYDQLVHDAVSYTHLDVYKRQHHAQPHLGLFGNRADGENHPHRLERGSGDELHHQRRRGGPRYDPVFATGGQATTGGLIPVKAAARPVSYTHLDVYKRQAQRRAAGRSAARRDCQ